MHSMDPAETYSCCIKGAQHFAVVRPACNPVASCMLLVQELKAKGLSAEDIDHGLRSVFGDAMRIEVVPADEADDEGVTVDTRFGKLTRPAAVEAQRLPQQ